MNRRQRWVVQAVLLMAAVLLAWRLGTEWQQADLRYSALANSQETSAAGLPVETPEEPLAVEEIAAKNLFSADRNNELPPPEVSQAGPPPPRPVVVGTMKLGESYEALMSESESSESRVRRVKQGEEVGGYRVVEIQDQKVVIEYEGQTTTLDIYQSRSGVAQPRTPTAARPAAPAAAGAGTAPARTPPAARAATPSQPTGQPTGREIQDPKYGPYTRIFIEGNQRRVERTTPFGIQRWYEPLQPGDKE
jgi:hypothetical protein